MFNTNVRIFANLRPGQTIAFDYARRTASGHASRIGEVVEVRPNHIVIEEIIGMDAPRQYRCFHKSAMMNVLVD